MNLNAKTMKTMLLKVIIQLSWVLIEFDLGERFNGKYTVHQKLGWGHFSTVWLVSDETQPGRYFALKIQKSKEDYC